MTTEFSQEELLDHYRHPRNRGLLEDANFSGQDYNPSCGDRVAIAGCIDESRVVKKLSFSGSGCVLSQAAASMLTELCIGKTSDQILHLSKDDILAMVGIPLGPTRLKCALLCLEVLRDGLEKHHIY